jgi:hypothetical protein
LRRTTAQCPGLQTQIVGASVHMDDYDAHKQVEGIVTGIVGLSKNFDLWNLGAHHELRRPPHTKNYLTYFGPKHQSKHLAKHLR